MSGKRLHGSDNGNEQDRSLPEPMRPVVMQTLRYLASHWHTELLENSAAPEALSFSPDDEELEVSPPDFTLDTQMAESAGTSWIFPTMGEDQEPDWCIFSLYGIDSIRDASVFRFSGRIRATVNHEDFIRSAYANILLRQADEGGLNVYSSKLHARQLRRRDVLKILASSQEAQDRRSTVLLVPQPSAWLSNAGVPFDPETDSRPIIVKSPR